ncbi:hypothetical protein [Nocardia callitridis]|uniref:AAA family ATPase n=1 Tax=Nocardia callitridis TaxID=648753 RepID=A0ABP9JTS8_9NOCA
MHPELRCRATERGELEGFSRPTEAELVYKVGAQVMLLTNDPMDRWVNGTIGQVISQRMDGSEPVVTVALPSGAVADVHPYTWEITQPIVETGRLRNEVVGTFTQLPFRLAWAITIHKSQGQTLSRLVIDLTGGTFADGQLYVALSRSTSMDGLVLRRQVVVKDLKTDMRVRRFLERGIKPSNTRGRVYLGVCTVGSEKLRVRPRPIEIALITDDGTEISTLVNPGRDLQDARNTYGITASDIQFAPNLRIAWAALAPYLEGRTPVGVDIDRQLGYFDTELKRHDWSIAMPIGSGPTLADLSLADQVLLDAPSALERARAARDLTARQQVQANGGTFLSAESGTGYLYRRGEGPNCFQVGGILPADRTPEHILAEHLRDTIGKIKLDTHVLARIRELEQALGLPIHPDATSTDSPVITAVLIPGARVCFTGAVTDDTGSTWTREDMKDLAEKCRLEPVDSVTKRKCDALVAAEAATQSGKGKLAVRYGTPIFTAQEFLAWADGAMGGGKPSV